MPGDGSIGHARAAILGIQTVHGLWAHRQLGERFDHMILLRLMALLGIAATITISHGVTGVLAQGKDGKLPAAAKQQVAGERKQRNLWYKLCGDFPMAEPAKPGEQPKPQKPEEMQKVHVCVTQADVRDNATVMLVGKIAVRQAGQSKFQLHAMLPLSSAIPQGALVKIDDQEPIKLVYTICDRAGCYAEADIDQATVDRMKSGKQIAYLGIGVTGATTSVPLTLQGFAEAIDGQPMSPETYNEAERKIEEVIKTRLAKIQEAARTTAPAQSSNK
jgi:invasion protein IalB